MSAGDSKPLTSFLAPRYWPLFLAIGLLRLVVLLPYFVLVWLSWVIGGLMMLVLPSRRRIVDVNLRLCFPDMDGKARRRIRRAHFASLAMSIFDFGLAAWASDERLARLVKIEGLENALKPWREGRGIIVLSGHFPAIEITGRVVAKQIDNMAAVYRPGKNELVNEFLYRARVKAVPTQLGKRDMRQFFRLLKQGGVPIWYASDQAFFGKGATLVPFFGVPAMTNTALTQIAKVGDTVVVPFLTGRRPGTQGYFARLLPPLEDFPTDDPAADALRVHHILEDHIREFPEQYYWIHRRFKHRPPEYGDPYANDS